MKDSDLQLAEEWVAKHKKATLQEAFLAGLKFKNKTEKKSMQEREIEFRALVAGFSSEYSKDILTTFYNYWSEPTSGGKKMRFETEKCFEIKRRLATWKRNQEKFDNRYGNRNSTYQRAESPTLFQQARKIVGEGFGNAQSETDIW